MSRISRWLTGLLTAVIVGAVFGPAGPAVAQVVIDLPPPPAVKPAEPKPPAVEQPDDPAELEDAEPTDQPAVDAPAVTPRPDLDPGRYALAMYTSARYRPASTDLWYDDPYRYSRWHRRGYRQHPGLVSGWVWWSQHVSIRVKCPSSGTGKHAKK